MTYDGARYTTDAYQHHQFTHLASHFQSFELVVPLERGGPPGRETLDTSGMTVTGLPAWRSGIELYLTRLHRWVPALVRLFVRRRRAWDAVVLYDLALPSQLAFAACRLLRLPIVFMLGGRHADGLRQAHVNSPTLVRIGFALYARWVGAFEGWVLSSTPAVLDFEPKVRGGRTRRYVGAIIPASAAEPRAVRSGSGLRLLVVSRVVPIKGIETAIRALSILRQRGRDASLRIVGPLYGDGYGRYEHMLRTLVDDEGLGGLVEFSGPVSFGDDLWKAYRDADQLLIPSRSEGTPKVLVEAFAKGVPVVASSVGGIPRILREAGAGLAVPPGDPAALADAVEHVAQDWNRYSTSAFRAAKRLTVEQQMSDVAAFVHEVVSGG